jgi:hypothetical protein
MSIDGFASYSYEAIPTIPFHPSLIDGIEVTSKLRTSKSIKLDVGKSHHSPHILL